MHKNIFGEVASELKHTLCFGNKIKWVCFVLNITQNMTDLYQSVLLAGKAKDIDRSNFGGETLDGKQVRCCKDGNGFIEMLGKWKARLWKVCP